MQMQAVADRLRGIETDLPLGSFWPQWSDAYEVASGDDAQRALNQMIARGVIEREEMRQLMELIDDPLMFLSLEDMADDIEPVDWWWPSWIPRRMLSCLGAEQGAGKSMIAEDLCHRLIDGLPFPDGSPMVSNGESTAIYIDAEDVPQVINDRAEWWQMDRSRFYLMSPSTMEREGAIIDLNDPVYQDELVEMCWRINPDLVVVDSLGNASSRGENNVEDVRDLLSFLNGVAKWANTSVLLVHHLRKPGNNAGGKNGFVSIHDFAGSRHITAMARSVIGLSVVQTRSRPDPNGPRRLAVIKTNLCKYPDPLGMEFNYGSGDSVFLEYGDAPDPYEEPTKEDECADWILETLELGGEPMKPKDLVDMAKEMGFSRAVVFRARDTLDGTVINTEGRRHPQNRWALADWRPDES
jgi:hypothetical protein